MKSIQPLLIVDPDEAFLRSLLMEPDARLRVATTGAEAQRILALEPEPLSGIFVSPKIASPHALSVLRLAHLKRAGTPLFLLEEGPRSVFTRQQKDSLGIQDSVSKPTDCASLMALVAPIVENFDADAALRTALANKDPVGGELAAEDAQFVPILSQNFLSGKRSFFDIYIRVRRGTFIKLLLAGEVFPPERLTSYIKKGVTRFYLRKEAQSAYLAYCDHLTEALLGKTVVSPQLKARQTLNLGQETMSFLRLRGIDEDSIQYAGRYVESMRSLIDQSAVGGLPEVRALMSDLAAYEHGAVTALVAGLVTQTLGNDTGRLAKLVGVSALLHDVGLHGHVPSEIGEEEYLMDRSQLTAYLSHAQRGAEILERVKGVDPAIVQAVRKHHERRHGHGLQGSHRTVTLFRIAELVGIADELVQNVIRWTRDPSKDPLELMKEKDTFDGFSFTVIDAFRKTFNMN